MLKDSRLAITERNSSDINKIDSFRDQFFCCLKMSFNFGEASSSCAISYSSIWCRDTQNIAVSPAVKVCWMTWNTKTTNAWPHCNKKVILGLLFLPVININCCIFSNITQHFSEINLGKHFMFHYYHAMAQYLSCISIYNSLDGDCCTEHIINKDKNMIYI